MRQIAAKPGLATLASSLLLACAGSPDATAPADPGPASLGAERILSLNAIYLGGDPSDGLVVGIGFAPGDTPEDVCEGSAGIPEGLARLIILPTGGVQALTIGHDLHLDVFSFTGFTDPCAMAGAPLVGSGTGKFTFQVLDGGPGATAIHATVQGIVDLVAGGQARVLATARVTILPDGTQLFDVERVILTPL
jgi:hypothetical protein